MPPILGFNDVIERDTNVSKQATWHTQHFTTLCHSTSANEVRRVDCYGRRVPYLSACISVETAEGT